MNSTKSSLPLAIGVTMTNRTVFSRVDVNAKFLFIGNPIVWIKISEFAIEAWDTPYATYDEVIVRSSIDRAFSTDAIVDLYNY